MTDSERLRMLWGGLLGAASAARDAAERCAAELGGRDCCADAVAESLELLVDAADQEVDQATDPNRRDER